MNAFEIDDETNRLQVGATIAILDAMDHAGLSRSELADRVGVPRSRITKILDGESNLTLRTFARVGLACGVRWHLVGTVADDLREIVSAPYGFTYAERSKSRLMKYDADVAPASPVATTSDDAGTDYPMAA